MDINTPTTIAIVVPTAWECRAVRRAIPDLAPANGFSFPAWYRPGLFVLQTGMGRQSVHSLRRNAAQLRAANLRKVWLVGCCGGVSPELAAGDVVLATSIVGDRSRQVPLGVDIELEGMLKNTFGGDVTVVSGAVYSSLQAIRMPEEKRRLAPAVAVEMEAAGVRRWASKKELEFAHVRIVLDNVGMTLPSKSLRRLLPTVLRPVNVIDFYVQRRRMSRTLNAVCRALHASRFWSETVDRGVANDGQTF